MPMADSTGMATVREQRPKPDRSWIAATRGVDIFDSSFPKTDLIIRDVLLLFKGGNCVIIEKIFAVQLEDAENLRVVT